MKPTRIIEICANSAQSCVEAEAGGAKRVELCAGIPEGGTTPSYGEIRTAQALTSSIDINVIIRPRGGDFLYTLAEIQSMLLDIELCKQLKVHGVVFGCLTKDGDIDVPLMRRLIETAKPLSVTCHRAFDVCRDPFAALEQLIEFGRITSPASKRKPGRRSFIHPLEASSTARWNIGTRMSRWAAASFPPSSRRSKRTARRWLLTCKRTNLWQGCESNFVFETSKQ